jgi:hypothetical protein
VRDQTAKDRKLRSRGGVERTCRDAASAQPGKPLDKLTCSLGRKRDRKDVLGFELAAGNLVRDPARDRRRLPRPRPGKDHHRPSCRGNRSRLLRV